MDYNEFLNRKTQLITDGGFDPVWMPDKLFSFQKALVEWACRKGQCAIFADCGLGKTAMQLAWAGNVARITGGRVLILTPLAVAPQTVAEGVKFGVEVVHDRENKQTPQITVANYERLHYFRPEDFAGVVLDESSILKSFTGKFRTKLTTEWGRVQYKLCCTATPAPNDYMELGNHSEFLGVMRGCEMLSAYFINDPGSVGHYRVKGHAESNFWRWVASWSCMLKYPSDIGYDDAGFALPKLNIREVMTDANKPMDGMLFPLEAFTMSERREARKNTMEARVAKVCEIANSTNEPFLVWCDLNAESEMLSKNINGAVEVKGADSEHHKETSMAKFKTGEIRCLVSKPSIAGWGMNFQHCSNMAFTGLSDSYEQYYQAVRRCWRFGQKKEVECYVVTDRTEGAVVANIKRKQEDAEKMAEGMRSHVKEFLEAKSQAGYNAFKVAYESSKKINKPSWLKGC